MTNSINSQSSLSILLIEDSKADALLIEKELNIAIPEGYHLKKAERLEDALSILSTHRFNVILLDRTLPDADNFDGLYCLQNMAPDLPIVFLTAYQNEDIAFESIKQGAQDYLLKDQSNGLMIKRAIKFAILRKYFEKSLIEQANFDVLTGLANRSLFENRLQMAIAKLKRQHVLFAVLFLDLDLFKKINDTYGHAVGDLVLKEVSVRFKKTLRTYDTAARFGGDEFAVLLDGIKTIHDAEKKAEKIIALIKKPMHIAGNKFTIDISIGIAVCQTYTPLKKLMQRADNAMYKAKSKSGSHYCVANRKKISL